MSLLLAATESFSREAINPSLLAHRIVILYCVLGNHIYSPYLTHLFEGVSMGGKNRLNHVRFLESQISSFAGEPARRKAMEGSDELTEKTSKKEVAAFVEAAMERLDASIDEETRTKKFKYRTLGDDHYRHATNYFLLAVQRVGVARNVIDMKRVKDRWAVQEDEYKGSFLGM